jgi:hypothetical protein
LAASFVWAAMLFDLADYARKGAGNWGPLSENLIGAFDLGQGREKLRTTKVYTRIRCNSGLPQLGHPRRKPMPTVTHQETHDHALAYSMLAAVAMIAIGIIAVWFYAS